MLLPAPQLSSRGRRLKAIFHELDNALAFKDRAPWGLRRHPRDLGVQVGESILPPPNRSYANAMAPRMTGQQAIYTDAEALAEAAGCNMRVEQGIKRQTMSMV